MDAIYTVRRKHIVSSKSMNDFDCLHEGSSLCSVSIKNVVAFSTRTDLEDTTGKTYGSHVYVADLNTPWHSYKVTTSSSNITALEWDPPGEKLLVAVSTGQVSIWVMKEHVLNMWTCIGTTVLPGESIIAAAFFHNGRKISIVAEKKDSVLYSERMSQVKFSPSVRQFGGIGGEGCLLITTTGIVCGVGIPKEGGRLITASESLSTARCTLIAADISYGKNGQFVVAACGGDLGRVQCYRVSVKLAEENKLNVTSQALPSFFLNSLKPNKTPCGKVKGLKFVLREDADSLVVASNMEDGSGRGVVEVWQLNERPIPLHRVFQSSSTETFKTVVWTYECSYVTNYFITAITTCKLALTTAAPPPSYILVATSDATLHCLYRDSLKLVGTSSLLSAWQDDAAKHQRLSTKITDMDLTWLGSTFVSVDSHGQLYLFKLPPLLEPGVGMTVNIACLLLDYCLVTGCDPWDVLVSLRPSLVDMLAERFQDNFSRQPPHTQQFYYVAHLALRIALARLVPNGENKAADLSSLLMLHSISTAFTSLLRPSDMSSDKGPAESLASVIGDNVSEVDKLLLHLEAKDFAVEPSTLQSLQQLIQWTADLSLNILARLPEQWKSSPQCELLRDYKALNTLRQLLVIIRVWGLLKSSCLPTFIKSAENIDVLALLFRLLSKLVQSHEPDETLIDECYHYLPSQVMIPQMNTISSNICVVSPLLIYQSLPIQLEFGVEPENLLYEPGINVIEGTLVTDQSVDIIRNIYLGKKPTTVKQCTRCGGKTQVGSLSRSTALRAWDQRWIRNCRCGGLWRIHKYT